MKHKQPAKKGPVRFRHDTDGVDHINVHYYASKTTLGRELSHFSRKAFKHPQYGPFNSLEAFWWWIRAETPDDQIRRCSADKARSMGRDWEKKRTKDNASEFAREIFIANWHRIDQNQGLKEMLIESDLPFTYYYLQGKEPVTQIDDKDSAWMIQVFENLRRMFKEGVSLDENDLPAFLK
jgi:hypothetical protein